MTSTTDTTGHPDVAEISDLTEGLLPPSRTSDVRRHLEDCELCADVYASLEEIRGVLGALPSPSRMPADVADRIDAALAAEAPLNATTPAAADAGAHVSRETSTTDRPAGHARTATGPGRKERRRGGRRKVAILGTVFTVAALGLGTVLLSTLNDGNPSTPEAQARNTTPDTFSEAKLGNQVAGLLKDQQSQDGSRSPHSLGDVDGSKQPKVFKAPTVPQCVQQGIGREDSPLATEQGRFEGKTALLVVLPDASGSSTRVTAYIVDASCVSHPSSAKAKVLLTHSYNRH